MKILQTIIDQAVHKYSIFFDQNGRPIYNTAIFITIDGKALYVEARPMGNHNEFELLIGKVYVSWELSTYYLDTPFESHNVDKIDFNRIKKILTSYKKFTRLVLGDIRGSIITYQPDSIEFDEF